MSDPVFFLLPFLLPLLLQNRATAFTFIVFFSDLISTWESVCKVPHFIHRNVPAVSPSAASAICFPNRIRIVDSQVVSSCQYIGTWGQNRADV